MVGLVLSVATIGCVKSDGTSANQSGMVTLQLSNGTLTTRAVGTNDDTNNEDLIANAQVFFFESDAVNATVLHSYYTLIGQNQQASMSIPLSANQLTTLFTNNKSYVYVIANYGSEISATTATTLEALKKTVITSTFGTDADGVQDSFIMDSELVEVTRGDANTITGEVFLTRAAAKVELTVKVKSLTQDGKTWVADTANMKVSFKNGVNKGLIDDGSDTVDDTSDDYSADLVSTDYFNIDGTSARGFTAVENVADSYVQSVPFYSYSTKWTAGSDNEVYLELAIPWKVQEQSASDSETVADTEDSSSKLTYQTFYYQVPVSVDALSLVRNAYYKLTLDVGVLGGLTEPVTVEPSYVVVNWGTNEVNVNLSRPKYLVVDKNRVVLSNLETIGVGYQSSDAVTVTILSSTIDGTNANKAYAVYGDYSVSPSGGEIVFSHQLDNTRGGSDTTYDYKPQTIVVRVAHTADPDIYEDITFIQYPALYVIDYALSSSTVFINGSNGKGSGSGHWYYVRGISSAATSLYTISVSAFDDTTADYLVADPREPFNTNNFIFSHVYTGSGVVTTATDAAGDKTLTGYRGAISGDAAANLVAPQFMISSSYISNGGNGNNYSTYHHETNGKYRCAAYQEYGYPAGRWRLPTPAELNVIGRLCAEGKIPTIFVNSYKYLSSNGAYRYNNGSFTYEGGTSNSVRCVYDIWYWKDKSANVDQFIWGAEGDIANGAKSDYLVPVE